MIFRNATLFRIPASAAAYLDTVDFGTVLQDKRLRPVSGLEMQSIGWVSPYGSTDPALRIRYGRFIGMTLGSETRKIPASVVHKAVAERIEKLEATRGKRVGGRERKRLRDEVLANLIPRAFVQPGRLNCYIDVVDGWLVVDTPSRKAAEALLGYLRETLHSLPAMPPDPEESVRALMTGWLAQGSCPNGLDFGDTAVLRDPSDRGAVARLRGQDLGADEVHEHLRGGKQVSDLGLIFWGRFALRLDEHLTVRNIRMLDLAEELEATERDTPRSEVDARFALFTLQFKTVVANIAEIFRWEQPRDRGAAP